jgi:hypothetical protein
MANEQREKYDSSKVKDEEATMEKVFNTMRRGRQERE